MSQTLYCIKKTIRYAYGSEKVSPLSKKMHLYVLKYILVSQPNIQHEEMLFNVIRHKQFSTYKMEL
ncbi:hypothetical protein EF900_15205 [Staphylococcus aureus]|nr:hypothetical protein AL487_005000 [Staphylococcus haemolyticus]RNM48272.1 hypothetical protein EF900_15205 [Staphylococcus aureus]